MRNHDALKSTENIPSKERGGFIGLAVLAAALGAGAALLTPETGPATRKLLGGTLSRIKVGAVDRMERHRRADAPEPAENPVRSVQELGRDSNDVF